jgi:hypothetical protein
VVTLPDLARSWPGYHSARLRDWLVQSGFCVVAEPFYEVFQNPLSEVVLVPVTEPERPPAPKKKKSKRKKADAAQCEHS